MRRGSPAFHRLHGEAARFGLTVKNVEDIVETAIGGKNIIQNVEGRERYPVNIRYPPDPISQVEDIKVTMGPPSIRDENGRLAGFVYVDVSGRDLGRLHRRRQKFDQEQPVH